jgi:SAM-dependent methyltransferase
MSASEHQRQILENQRHWDAKPELRRIYRDFHRLLAENLSTVAGETVEIGSGIGNIREVIPACVRTDLFENPWIDRRENIYTLSMADRSVANLILFDVFHHLEFPMAALRECRRVLARGGRLLVFDHAMSGLGVLFSKFIHHEKMGFAKPYSLASESTETLDGPGYYADHANAHRILVRSFDKLLESDWKRVCVIRLAALKWLLSGGYRGPSFLGILPKGMVEAADVVASVFPGIFALRLLVVMESQ